VVAANPEFIKFFDLLIGRSPELFRKEIAAQKKLLKESIANIPARIDEVSRAIVADPDYGMIEKEISDYCKRISEIDIQLNSEAENYNAANKANQERQNKIFEKQRAIDQLKNEDLRKADQSINHLKLKKNELDSEISWYDRNFTTLNNSLDSVKRKITQLNEENANLRSQWEKINESVIKFNEDEFSCPTCKRAFESDDIEAKKVEMLASFNKNKMSRLDQITNTGKSNKAEIERLSQEAVRIQDQIDNEKTHANEKIKERDAIIIPSHAPAIESNPQIAVLQSEIEAIKAEIKPIGKTDDTVLKTEKDDLRVKIDFNKTLLNIKAENAKHKTRKTELINQEKSLAQQIADLEKQEFQADAFEKAKIDMVEEKVNSMFTTVKFKMFNTLINGGTEPCCETLINGVPYADANNAAKIQGGLDIIRTLSRHYDVYAPVFIDNRESVTDIPDMECQIINLIVDPSQKTLQVKNYSDIPEQLTFKN
jgi:DNA repair exonuclease SbcCD ATPase subunit